MIKKLLGIVVLGLLLSGNAFGSDIKIKRIECKNPKSKDLFNSKFIIISNNGTKAQWFEKRGRFYYNKFPYDVKSSIQSIKFYYKDTDVVAFRIERSSGKLLFGIDGAGLVGLCDRMPENFNPEAYFNEQTKKNRVEKKKSDKF